MPCVGKRESFFNDEAGGKSRYHCASGVNVADPLVERVKKE
jgi:hypothetical protein